jgi:chromate transport protein ChrA
VYKNRKISKMDIFNERFVSENESNESVKNIFTTVGFALLGMLITMLLIWSYNLSDRNQYMFIVVYSSIIMIYCIIIVSITAINKNSYDYATYNVLLGFSVFMIFLTFAMVIIFLLRYFNIFSSNYFGQDNARYY